MGRISTYPRDTYVTGLDKWIGSDANTENFATKNFTANAVADYFNRTAIIDTGSFSWQYAPYSTTQPQAEKTFQQIDRVAQNISITGLAVEPLRVSALTMANTMPRTFIINEWVGQSILVHVPSGPSQYAIYNVVAVTPDTEWFFLLDLEFVSGTSGNILEGESIVFGFWSGANIVTSVEATFPIIATGDNDVVISLDPTTNTNWNTAYNRSLVSASVTGTATKTLTLTKQDGGTITASWVDQNTDAVVSVFGRTGAIVAQAGDYTTTLVTEGTNLYFTDQRARNVISSSIAGIAYSNTTGIFSLATGYFIPTTAQSATWDTAYNRSLTSAVVTGTTTKVLTLNKQDGGTITASWTDDNTNLITSVFGRTGAVVAQSGDYTTTLVTEGDNLYFTTARARTAISLTVTGTSGPATYSSATGVLNIPQYQGGVTSFNTRTGAITLTSTDVTDALGFTPENITNKSNDTALGTSATLYPTQNAVKTYVDSATAGGIILQGDWNAATNVPDITGTTRTGFAWRVSVAGNTNLGGITDWLINDLAVKTATGWIKIDNTESVTSVFGRFGTVVAQSGDYNTDLVTEGTTNLYFTTARARTSISAGTGITYNSTTGVISSSGGSVTSVGLSMPSAFTVTNSPVTSTGTLTVTGAGTTAQYIRGDGSLATLPGTSAEARSIVREVYNKTGATLTKGTVVYINSGQGNLPAVTKAIATGDMTSAQTFGIVQTDITDQNNGFVVVAGGLENLDTQGLGVGTQLYLSSTVAGAYTTVKQYAPAHLVYVAIVVRDHPTQGVIEVNIQNGYELDELHNVSARNPANNDIIAYNTTTSLWEKKSIATTLGYTPANAATTLTINGTAFDLSANRTWSVGTVTSVGLALGTSGTDANISNSPITSTGEITLNLPTASATNRGLLSNGDWTTFNSKQTALNGTGFVKSTAGVISYDPSTYTPTSRTLTINGVTYDLSADRSWTVGASTSARTEQTFTSTAGTNTFTITGGYVVGLIDVYVNGVKYPPADYTASNGTTVVITGLVAADIVSVVTYTANITVPSVSGSGTANSIARFVGSTAIGDSGITDNGTTVTLVSRALNGTSATFSSTVNAQGGLLLTTAQTISTAGSIGFQSSVGTFIYSKAGTDFDFRLYNGSGVTVMSVPTGTQAATFSSSVTATQIGINTSLTTSHKLQIQGGADSGMIITNSSGATRILLAPSGAQHGEFALYNSSGNATTYLGGNSGNNYLQAQGGNVGISNTSPSYKLDIHNGSDFDIRLRDTSLGGTVGILFETANDFSGTSQAFIKGIGAGNSGASDLIFGTAAGGGATTGSERMRITSGGDLALGTSTVSWAGANRRVVEINGTTQVLIGIKTGDVQRGYIYHDSTNLYTENSRSGGDWYLAQVGAGRMIFSTDGVERLRIDASGSVVMQKHLQLYCSTGSQDGMYIQNTSNNTSANAIIFRGWNNSTTGSIATYVNLTTYNTSSDYRLKEDLKHFSGLDLVSKLKMYDFKWKEADWRMYGGLAHEIAEVLPYAVNGKKDAVDKDGNVSSQGVDYSTIVPLLIQSIKELKAELDTAITRLQLLENK